MKNFMNLSFDIQKIVLACFVASGIGKLIHKNRPSHGLALHLGGVKKYQFENGKTLLVKKNDIIYLPKHSTYTVGIEDSNAGDCYAINFHISEAIDIPPFVFGVKNTSDFLCAFKTAEQTWKTKRQGFEMKCKEQLYHILYQMQQEYHSEYIAKDKFEMIAPAVKYIHEKYTSDPLNIAELSALCGISPEYFRSIFHKFYGTSPVKYINDLKITRAKELIVSGMYTVNEAAERSGFSDISYFSRTFKKITGIPPSEYR